MEQLRKELLEEKKRRKHFESEVQVLTKELGRTEESKKQLEFDLATLSRNKGEKMSKVMNMLKRAEGEYKEEKGEHAPVCVLCVSRCMDSVVHLLKLRKH